MTNILTIDNLLKSGESQTVEFKASFGRETVETLVAFANAQGGTVLIGVADDGSVLGTTIGKETLNDWLGQIKSATSPSVIPNIDAVQIENKWIVVIHINEYPVKPVNTKGRYFKRVANSNHQLGLSEITNLYLQSLQASWDAHEAHGESLDALSVNKIEIFSPGTLYGGITIEALKTDTYQSSTRNKLIAEAFYLTNNIEKYGSGYIRIREELKVYPELTFNVEETCGGILVSFCQSGGVNEGVNGGVNAVFNYIRLNPGVKVTEMTEALDVPKRTLERWIKQLRDERKVNFKGAPKTGGYYVAD